MEKKQNLAERLDNYIVHFKHMYPDVFRLVERKRLRDPMLLESEHYLSNAVAEEIMSGYELYGHPGFDHSGLDHSQILQNETARLIQFATWRLCRTAYQIHPDTFQLINADVSLDLDISSLFEIPEQAIYIDLKDHNQGAMGDGVFIFRYLHFDDNGVCIPYLSLRTDFNDGETPRNIGWVIPSEYSILTIQGLDEWSSNDPSYCLTVGQYGKSMRHIFKCLQIAVFIQDPNFCRLSTFQGGSYTRRRAKTRLINPDLPSPRVIVARLREGTPPGRICAAIPYVPKGGTHASPGYAFWRRAHERHLPDGSVIQIPATLVCKDKPWPDTPKITRV